MKRTIVGIKNSLQGLKIRFELAEERTGEFEDRSIVIIHSKEQKEKRIKKTKQSLGDMCGTSKVLQI